MYVADGMTNHDDGDDFSGIHALWSVKRKDERRILRAFGMGGGFGDFAYVQVFCYYPPARLTNARNP